MLELIDTGLEHHDCELEPFISTASFWTPELINLSAWIDHAPFAFWLVEAVKPQLFVELGTHLGFSYFVFNQALARMETKCRCFAVDTWLGDEHSGTYGDEVFAEVHRYNETHYGDFSELLRMTFDEALPLFHDSTIDLLHIDGRHYYDDVKHDFESWRPKLSNRGVVVFHDTNVRSRDFGVYRLWDELKREYPHFEFLEGHGLGILATGQKIPPSLQLLFETCSKPAMAERVRAAYARLGSAVVDRAKLQGVFGPPWLPEHQASIASLEDENRSLNGTIDRLREEQHQLDISRHELQEGLERQGSERKRFEIENNELRGESAALKAENTALKTERNAMRAENTALRAEGSSAETTELRAEYERLGTEYASLSEAGRILEAQVGEIDLRLQNKEEELKELQQVFVTLQNAQNELAEANTENGRLQTELQTKSAQLMAMSSSVSWRVTAPIRKLLAKAPWARRVVVVPLKLFWWVITFQFVRQLQVRRICNLISRSGLFDREFYLGQNPDVAASGLDPVRHYFLSGARDGRNPHPIFASDWYLEQNPDVASLGCNPLEHFLLHGRKEGRLPTPLFDPNFYRQQIEPALRASIDPLEHFLKIGRASGLSSHPLIDSRWYLNQNPDVSLAGVDALSHYLSQGWKEGRDPSPLFRTSWYLHKTRCIKDIKVDPLTHYLVYGWHSGINPHPLFDGSFYLERNTDVSTGGLEPLTHYITNGAQEGRDPHPLFDSAWYVKQNPGNLEGLRTPLVHFIQDGWRANLKPHRLFDTEWYLTENPDIAASGINPLEHYLLYGGFEGRDPHPLFDSDWYLSQNPDVAAAGVNPLLHYVRYGWRELRNPHEYFNVSYYLNNHPALAETNAEPLAHFLSRDPLEAGNPHPQFDTAWYLRQYRDAESSSINPLIHYVRWGKKEGRSRHPVSKIESIGPVEHARHKVVFISGESHTPGHLYRVSNLATALAPRFFDTVVVKIEEIRQGLKQIEAAEILWIWRAPWSEDLATAVDLASRRGAKTIFDTDDLMFRPELAREDVIDGIRSQDLPTSTVEDHFRRIRSTLIRADHCTSPTTALTLQIRRLNRPASVIPNGFDRNTVELARSIRQNGKRINDGLIRIGYASGSRTHQRDLAIASRAIAAILRENANARLVLFRNTVDISEFPEFYAVENQLEWRDLVSVANLPCEYARFDINIAPLEVGNEFCESKSELKYFEAALVNVPTVASPTEPFCKAIRNGENGFLAGNDEEWYTHLNCLVTDAGLRSSLAQKAYSEVIWMYGPERRSLLVTNLVTQLLSDSPVRAQLFAFDVTKANVDAIPSVSVPEVDIIFQSSRKGTSRVTIIVPLYNYGHFLPDALESVRWQTVGGLDVIVVDDRSTDDSLQLAKDWLERHASEFNSVVLLQNRQNSKLGATRNAGIAFSDTELFLPLDPDNLLLPDCVEKCMKQLDETGAAFAYPTMDVFGEDAGRMGIFQMGTTEFDPTLFNSCNYIDAMALVRKACWTAVGGYSALDPAGWEDYDFWCKLVEKGFFGIRVNETVAKYRAHGSSMLGTITDKNKKLVVQEIVARHPWLGLPAPEDVEIRPAEQPKNFLTRKKSLSFEKTEPLENLIGILQCPETGEDLRIGDQNTLISMSGQKIWPVVNGRPVFTSEGRNVFIHPDTHISNPLPEEAIRIIKQTQGRVLNLSAGGSTVKYRNVVELEYSIFKNTDIIGDVHRLPFHHGVFDAVVCLNAFEHYREPDAAMNEIRRVLRPGGQFFLHTAFLQPLHEAPHHYYNCTEFGLRHWLRNFNVEYIRVSDNFNPVYAISWLASEIESAFITSVSPTSAQQFREARVHEFAMFWRDPETRKSSLWEMFYRLPPEVQHRLAAGFEGLAKK